MSMDSGIVVVIIISMMYMVLVFGLLFYVKNEWCDLLFKNFTVMFQLFFYPKVGSSTTESIVHILETNLVLYVFHKFYESQVLLLVLCSISANC
jgi:hypothetical protein